MLRPDVTPEMGFQSYEMLAGDSENRKAQEVAFMAGEIRNPRFNYPLIDFAKLKNGINNLDRILTASRSVSDRAVADAIWDSAAYRMAEMYWLMEAARLNEFANDPTSEAYKASAARFQDMNEQLYGRPDAATAAAVYGEILAQATEKELHPTAQHILDELSHGTTLAIAGESVVVDGIQGKESGRLPENIQEKLTTLAEVLREDFADAFQLVDDYWDEVVLPRAHDACVTPGFNTQDMKVIFETLHTIRDPENKSGISVVIHPGSSQLAWDTPTMSVRIGEGRAPITSKTDMVAKLIHEYGVHGLRAVNGLQTDLPILGTGVYSDADLGEQSDYLTFEEGFASLCEIAIDGSFTKWKPLHVSRYLADVSMYEGADYRQAFEINWRARVLMSVKPGQAVDEALIAKEKKQAYKSVTRIDRSTPTHLTGGPVVTFNKDLGYLGGKLIGLGHLERIGDNKVEIRRLFASKTDPTNHRQDELAKKYSHTVR